MADSATPNETMPETRRMTGVFEFSERENGVAFLKLDAAGQKVNILTSEVMLELNNWLDELSGNSRIRALVIHSGKEDNFIAGADVGEIKDINDPEEGAEKAKQGQAVFQKIHDLPFPVIAAIQGTCVGGGLELALACHFRIARIHPKTRIGLPEVKLGILPGFGGTQRLPRLIGIQRSLSLILTGKLIDAQYAGRLGIIDRVLPVDYPFSFLKAAAEEFALSIQTAFLRAAYEKKRNAKRLHAILLESNAVGRRFLFKQARQRVMKTSKGHYPAPLKALEAVEMGYPRSLEQGLKIEAKLLGELIATDVSKNLISIYYLNEDLKKDPGVDKAKEEARRITHVGLLGAGVMGGGIAQLLAYNDLPVRMKDINQEAVDVGLSKAEEVFESAVSRKKLSRKEMRRKMTLISGTTDYSGFGPVDMVIEAVVENMDIKKKVFAEIEERISDKAILASNTSSLSITEIADAVKKPQRAIGFHFFNPVHRMPLVEIIRGEKTSDSTTITSVAFAKQLGKIPVVVKNSPGFLVNRILGPYINEAALMLEEGEKIDEIDKEMEAFGMPMGPLNLLDEVGLDVGYKVSKILAAGFPDRGEPSQVVALLCEADRLGKKNGRGFYVYVDKSKRVDDSVYELISKVARGKGELPKEQIQERLVLAMLKEGILCLQEEIVRAARDVDAGMIFGTGFPPFRGGLIRYADTLGAANVLQRMQALEDQYGSRFTPPELLIEKAKKKERFYA